jgi:TRAP-type C4-dicarboxylate transport system substrate-binding protein
MRSEWERGTEGRVRAIVYPSGQQGDEGSVLLKLQSGTLDAAALMLPGLCRIDEAFNVFGIPLFFGSYDELNDVAATLTPMLRARLEAKGFVLLHWGHAGWVRVFSTRPARTLDDLKGLKMYTTAGDEEMIRVYQRHGFRPIALAPTAILTGLTSGMVEALPTTPTAMLFFQWYGRAKYMLDIPVAPLVGATVMTTRAWNTIAPGDRAAILKAAAAAEARLARDIPRQDEESIAVMRGKGVSVLPGQGADWNAEAQLFAKDMKGMVPDAVYAAAVAERDAFRSQPRSARR